MKKVIIAVLIIGILYAVSAGSYRLGRAHANPDYLKVNLKLLSIASDVTNLRRLARSDSSNPFSSSILAYCDSIEDADTALLLLFK